MASVIVVEDDQRVRTALVRALEGFGHTVTGADTAMSGLQSIVATKPEFAKKAFDQFGTPELKTFLNDTGLGNHPELVRWAFRVGGALSEDGIVKGRQGDGTSSDDLAAILYPTSINKAA